MYSLWQNSLSSDTRARSTAKGWVREGFIDSKVVCQCCGAPAVLVTDLGSTPEPGTLVMLGSGLVGLAGVLRRKLKV